MPKIFPKVRCGCLRLLFFAAIAVGLTQPRAQAQATSDSYKGSAVQQKATPGILPLSLDDAMQLGLKNNLGAILQNSNVNSEGGAKLQQLQALLPTLTGTAEAAVSQVNLQAEGLRIPGFPAVIGPFGYTDFRATLN
ncbi:MAG: hypothetical protein WBG23_03685, partial [Acidobacteriaceae bacterium]